MNTRPHQLCGSPATFDAKLSQSLATSRKMCCDGSNLILFCLDWNFFKSIYRRRIPFVKTTAKFWGFVGVYRSTILFGLSRLPWGGTMYSLV